MALFCANTKPSHAKADAFGVGFITFSESAQESQDIVGCYLIDFMVTEFLVE
jgi:hypothetical protein